ncbi:hypothetical protein I79_000565 [Cricetulus griseus]|uniref:Uncharacterized protein n=1 Tax=Cricetulus griseus TaxID=10029 RepID=G3GSF4_CRIGR|nr:hypothetical protein I79_000565 [Cricetulus griseus]
MKQLVCSSLGRASSSAPSFPQLPIVLYVELRPHGHFSPVQFGIFIDVIFVQLTFIQSYW